VAAGVDARHLFEDHASGAKDSRPGLAKALDFVQPGDVLVVWKRGSAINGTDLYDKPRRGRWVH